jgi:hypothetical protein
MNLVLYLGADYITVQSFEEAVDLIAKEPLIKLIITKDVLPEQNIALNLKNYLDQVGKQELPMIILGDQHKIENLRDNHYVVESPTNIKAILKTSAEKLGITAADMADVEMPTFYPIEIDHFLVMEKTVCDVYFERANTKGTGVRYIKRIMKDFKYPHDIIREFKEGGMTHLYILSDYRLEFINAMTNDFINMMKSKEASTIQKMAATGRVQQIFNEKFNADGFTEEAEKIAKEAIQSITALLSSSKNLKELLDNLLANQNSHMYIHCQSIAYVADKVIDNMEWGSKEQKEKLNFIIFMHDSVLQNDLEATIKSEEELDSSSLDDTAKERVRTHASKIAAKFQELSHLPFGSDTIIMQHHGTRNGIGFNPEPPNNLSPLAIVFFVCEQFINMIQESDMTKTDPQELLEKIHFRHKKKDKFTKVVECLAKVNWGY